MTASLNPKRKPIVSRRLLVTAAIVASVLVLSYAWYQYRFPHWEEAVTLPDGRTVVVKERRDFIEGRGTRKTWLTFSLPEMGGEQTWSEYLYPTMIGATDGKVYVIGRPRGNTQFSTYAFPRYVYVAFVWKSGSFERLPFTSVPGHLRSKENIRWCLPGGSDTKAVVRAAGQWCVERVSPDDPFLMPQLVDLELRKAEALDWARSAGLQPSSD